MDSHRSSRQVTQFSSVTQSKRSCVFPFCTLNEWVFKCNRCTYESSFHSSSKQSCIVWHILSSVHVILFTFVPNQNNWIFVYLFRWEKKEKAKGHVSFFLLVASHFLSLWFFCVPSIEAYYSIHVITLIQFSFQIALRFSFKWFPFVCILRYHSFAMVFRLSAIVIWFELLLLTLFYIFFCFCFFFSLIFSIKKCECLSNCVDKSQMILNPLVWCTLILLCWF